MGIRMIKILLFFLFLPGTLFALPAFPGAEGMGASTTGGRGGTVYVVDTLSDDPADGVTFREACEASGARIVIFSVSGIIHLTSQLTITNDFLTIAGQTSPGGILVADKMVVFSGVHDVIVTHMRFRKGTHVESHETAGDVVQINGLSGLSGYGLETAGTHPSYNIIFDHCSFSWGTDETVNLNNDIYDITFSWCAFTFSLNSPDGSGLHHNFGLFQWGRYNSMEVPTYGFTVHHSFIGFQRYRLPEVNFNGFVDSANNVTYYYQSNYAPWLQPGDTSKLPYANYRHNYADTRGSVTSSTAASGCADMSGYASTYHAVYMHGCLSGSRTSQSEDQWDMKDYNQSYCNGADLSTDYRSDTPFATRDIAVTITTMSSEYAATVVSGAGASVPSFDSVDKAGQAYYAAGTGEWTDDISEEDWPTFSTSGDNPTDSDSDGMWDTTETAVFGDLSKDGTADSDGDGYSDIEEYLFYLAGYQGAEETTTTHMNRVNLNRVIMH